jgi:hypothetical protein
MQLLSVYSVANLFSWAAGRSQRAAARHRSGSGRAVCLGILGLGNQEQLNQR